MSQLRERWEGVSLPGDYLLQRWVSGDDHTAFFEGFQGEVSGAEETALRGQRFMVKVIAQRDVDGSAQLAMWQRTKALEHPNLRRLLDFGRVELDGQIVLYAVMENADDSLAAALAQGPLTEPEAREGSVFVEGIAVGVCGTDVEIVQGKYGWAPPGKTRLVLISRC